MLEVVTGGVLAVMGGVAAQWMSARARRAEAERDQLEAYRREAVQAVLAVREVVLQSIPDAFHVEDELRLAERVAELDVAKDEADRRLLALEVGRPPLATAEKVAEAAGNLRGPLRATARGSILHGQRGSSRRRMGDATGDDYDQALRLHLEARESAEQLEELVRRLRH